MQFNKIQINLLIGILFIGLLTCENDVNGMVEKEGVTTSNPFRKFEVDRRTDLLDLEVIIKQKSSLVLRILDETGKEIFHSATEVNQPRFRTRVDIASFPRGKYKIVIYTNDGRYIRNFQK